MRHNPYYALRQVGDSYYLFPFSKSAMNHHKVVKVNEIGAFIWKVLDSDVSVADIVSKCIDKFECSDDQLSKMENVINDYLGVLATNGLLCLESKEQVNEFSSTVRSYLIAGIRVNVCSDFEIKEFSQFACDERTVGSAEQNIYIIKTPKTDFMMSGVHITKLFSVDGVTLYRQQYGYCIDYDCYENISRVVMSYDGKTVLAFYSDCEAGSFQRELFDVLRTPFLYIAQKLCMIAIHAATIDYNNKAWLLTGKSGTGKSTLAEYMHEESGISILNGDVALICIKNEVPTFCGIPWCGTSGISNNVEARLGGIIILNQGQDNYISDMIEADKVYNLMGRSFSPLFTELDVDTQIDCLKDILRNTKCFKFTFVNDISSAKTLSKQLEVEKT